tara:strand:- start:3306 stop:3782 length:477 start_codon:yes stop_codon:yes gene_type:complete
MTEAGGLVAELMAAEGELSEELAQGLEGWAAETGDKLGALRAVYRRLEAEVSTWKHEEQLAQGMRKRAQDAQGRVKGLAVQLLLAREELGEPTSIKGVAHLRKTVSGHYPEELVAWPEGLLIAQDPKPDRRGALERMKSGELTADGFELVERCSVIFK